MVQGKEIETMQTVLYIEQIGDVWTWLIERCGGSVQDSRFRTSFSTSARAEKAARIWAEMHGLAIDKIDFQPAAPLTWQEAQRRVEAKVQKLEADLAETKTELAAARKAQTVKEDQLTLAERKLDRVRSVLNGDL